MCKFSTTNSTKEGKMLWREVVEHIWWVVGGVVIGANVGFLVAALLSAAHDREYKIDIGV